MEYKTWTQSAIECYSRQCICTGCPIKAQLESKCYMKTCVMELLEKFGEPPNFMNDDIFPDMSEKQRKIIDAILNGANTTTEIAAILNTSRSNTTTYLNQLYQKVQHLGLKFKRKKDRLPEFVEFVNELKEQS